MKPTTYSGYTVWPEGLSVWPRRKLAWRWAGLAGIQSAFAVRGEGIDTKLTFNDGRTLVLRGAQIFSFGTGPGRFAELVAQAVAAAPAEAAIDDLTFEIAQWGPREVRQRFQASIDHDGTPEKLLERARHHRVWMERRPALQGVDAALRLRPDYPEALQLRHRLMLEKGDAKRARRTAEDWLARCPQDPPAQAATLLMRLAQDDRTAAPEAARFLEANTGHDELTAGLAGFYFRAGDYTQAAECWGRIGQAAKDSALRQQAQEMQRYAEKTARNSMFRWREKLMRWGKLTLAWTVILVTLAIQAVRFYEVFTRKEREQERRHQAEEEQRKWAEETKERIAAMDRQFTEITGRVTGDYAAVRTRADRGEAAAQLTLAEMLWDGSKGAPKDPAAALGFLEKAAAQGHRAALLSLGQDLVEGTKIPKDAARAAVLFEQAMDKDSPRAAAELAELYQKGDGVAQDKARAFALYAKAAEGGYVYAMSQAGWLLERGEGVAADRAAALNYYRDAADKKSEWATERLVRLLGVPTASAEERAEALKWLKLGAQRGSAELRIQAAMTILPGQWEDVELGEKKVREWLEEAVKAEQPGARTQLGLCLLNGWGMKQDFARADEMFESASLQDPIARSLLVRNLAFGVGMSRDLPRAKVLLKAIADTRIKAWLQTYMQAAEGTGSDTGSKGMLFQDQPTYPARLARKGIEGRAVVNFHVDPEGFTERVEVISATEPEFGCAARLAVSFWRFAPTEKTENERHIQVPIEFELSKGSPSQVK